eukprot:CAMPEP_0117660632 /NCGR_PEP_ID=MMETSP0804-20121206/7070_1 /TAXON_ID=1074897 /ORGANISM="Tetraselmis astigmatica, Strain CCMP880" /LENGTH=436 /DNA_ID=CAMNT_0005467371 /DNA_START=375 /DNA_END=1685 /DNA_ORIENTATION=-
MDRAVANAAGVVATPKAVPVSVTPLGSPLRNPRPARRNDAAASKDGPSTTTQDQPGNGVSWKPQGQGKGGPIPVGIVALIGVAFLWGTYTPVLRFLYDIEGAPSPSMLTAVRGVLGSLVLGLSSLLWAEKPKPDKHSLVPIDRKCSMSANLEEIALLIKDEMEHRDAQGLSGTRLWAFERMTATSDKLWVAGVEMGFWNFMGTALQAIGLEYTTATRAAFIIQSTALFTPLISSLAGETLTTNTWSGCLIAMMGTLLVTAEHTGDPMSQTMSAGSFVGDACVLGAAIFYACTTVRLGVYAHKFPAVQLATAKTVMLCIISLFWISAEVLEGTAADVSLGQSLVSRWENYTDITCWVCVVFSALGPGALAAYLQTVGQSNVAPSQAQIIFSSVPLWSALLAVLILHEQPMGLIGWTGGLFIIAGGYFATSASNGNDA